MVSKWIALLWISTRQEKLALLSSKCTLNSFSFIADNFIYISGSNEERNVWGEFHSET